MYQCRQWKIVAGLLKSPIYLVTLTRPPTPPSRPTPKSSEQPRLKQRGETDDGAELAIMV